MLGGYTFTRVLGDFAVRHVPLEHAFSLVPLVQVDRGMPFASFSVIQPVGRAPTAEG